MTNLEMASKIALLVEIAIRRKKELEAKKVSELPE